MSFESSSEFAKARPYKGLVRIEPATSVRWRMAFLRAIIWSLIGMIYAPLFIGLLSIAHGAGLGSSSYVLAAGLAGGAGAVLYGAREVALIGTGIGAAVGVALLILMPGQATLTNAVVVASILAATVGLTFSFPRRCTRHVPGKLLAGLVMGALGGAVLAIAEPFHSKPFSTFSTLLFLASVHGVLYVGSVRAWIRLSGRLGLESRPCDLIEASTMAILAAIAAGSLWMVAGPLMGFDPGLWQLASFSMHEDIAPAFLGGLFGGAMAGLLLEVFRFPWVHDV